MERLFQAIMQQSGRFILCKLVVFTALIVVIYGEVYSSLSGSIGSSSSQQRSYKTPWMCHSKAAFNHPNPYYGDINVSEEFSMTIDMSLLIVLGGAVATILGVFLKRFSPTRGASMMPQMDFLLAASYFCWLLYATVGRFSHTGRVCSGAYHNIDEVMYPYDYQ